jgi:hypothetical protein
MTERERSTNWAINQWQFLPHRHVHPLVKTIYFPFYNYFDSWLKHLSKWFATKIYLKNIIKNKTCLEVFKITQKQALILVKMLHIW